MDRRDTVILKKILSEIAVAQEMLGNRHIRSSNAMRC